MSAQETRGYRRVRHRWRWAGSVHRRRLAGIAAYSQANERRRAQIPLLLWPQPSRTGQREPCRVTPTRAPIIGFRLACHLVAQCAVGLTATANRWRVMRQRPPTNPGIPSPSSIDWTALTPAIVMFLPGPSCDSFYCTTTSIVDSCVLLRAVPSRPAMAASSRPSTWLQLQTARCCCSVQYSFWLCNLSSVLLIFRHAP